MVFSASTIEATVTFHDPYYFLKKQAVYAVVSTLVVLAVPSVRAVRRPGDDEAAATTP